MGKSALSWRFVGPYRGGRVMAVAGHPTEPMVAYFGSTGGGVWRTTDAGASWHNLSDRFFKRSSVGALAIAPSDPQTIYVGMGECGFRGNVTHGDGMYRTRDGGKTWEHLGLADTQNIARIRVHPGDANVVFVAAMGHRFGPNAERGIYRSQDGGRHWERILYQGPETGAAELVIDPSNSRILYAALWQAQRFPWGLASGGPGSGIYKSIDGGDSWRDLSLQPGLPPGVKGKIALSVSPTRPDRVYAIIAAPEGGGIYRSSDGGETWTWTNNDQNFLVRGWYEARIEADPSNPDTVWLPNRKLWKSRDGGRTFAQCNTSYWDQHDIWIDPRDNRRMVLGNDGGASVSLDGGLTWSSVFNQPTAEMYHASTDTHFPYRIYGAQQDSSTLSMPSRSDLGPISEKDWYDVGGGESSFIFARPDDPDIVYAGDLGGVITRYDHRTRQLYDISPWPENMAGWPADALPYRFNWSTPLLISRHDAGELYVGANCLFRTNDEGRSWRVISPDLTRHEGAALTFLASTGDQGHWHESGEEDDYATIASISDGIERGVLWTGSDDGVVSLTRDDGSSWSDVTPPELASAAICMVEASPHMPGGAYLAATRHKVDDFRPHIFKTSDFGGHWHQISSGIPEDEFVRVVRADPDRAGLLYCGTEVGVYVSLDDGLSWRRIGDGLPACAIYDLALHENGDLVAATHGRGMWILDDLSPLRQRTDFTERAPAHLFVPRPAYRLIRQLAGIPCYIAMGYPDAAANPPPGIEVTYSLRESTEGTVTLTLLDSESQPIAAYSNKTVQSDPAPLGPIAYHAPGGRSVLVAAGDEDPEPGLRVGMRPMPADAWASVPTCQAGLNRFVIPLIYPPVTELPGTMPFGDTSIPVPPGQYLVRLDVHGHRLEAPATVLPDPRVSTTTEEYRAQFVMLLGIHQQVAAIHAGVRQLRETRLQLVQWALIHSAVEQSEAQVIRARALIERLTASEQLLVQPRLTDRSGELMGSHFPVRLKGKLESLASTVSGRDAAPTAQAVAVYEKLTSATTAALSALESLITVELAAFNKAVWEAGLPAIVMGGSQGVQRAYR